METLYVGTMSITDLNNQKIARQAANLIYDSDPEFFKGLVGRKGEGQRLLQAWFREIYGVFNRNNISILKDEKKIKGIAVVIDLTDPTACELSKITSPEYEYPYTFEMLVQKYFNRERMFRDGRSIVVFNTKRDKGDLYSSYLLKYIIESGTSPVYINVDYDNLKLLEVCYDLGFSIIKTARPSMDSPNVHTLRYED